jgi:serine/threonine protein kinase
VGSSLASQFDPLIGREIDGYLIERLLGKGGMARVYRAQDVRLGRYAAIKVIVPEARSAEDYIRRFEKEARAVAQLQHPHIVSIYRFGEVGGLLYMAMQYIDGTDLGWVLLDYAQDNQLMSHDEILHVVTQIASALDYAHSKGVGTSSPLTSCWTKKDALSSQILGWH